RSHFEVAPTEGGLDSHRDCRLGWEPDSRSQRQTASGGSRERPAPFRFPTAATTPPKRTRSLPRTEARAGVGTVPFARPHHLPPKGPEMTTKNGNGNGQRPRGFD